MITTKQKRFNHDYINSEKTKHTINISADVDAARTTFEKTKRWNV